MSTDANDKLERVFSALTDNLKMHYKWLMANNDHIDSRVAYGIEAMIESIESALEEAA